MMKKSEMGEAKNNKDGKFKRPESMTSKNKMRMGGKGLSLEAFANAKSKTDYNPALISCRSDMATMVSLKDIVPAAQNNINTHFILLDKGRITLDSQHKACIALVADETAAVHFQFWGEECEAFEPGDIIHLTSGIFSYNRNNTFVLRAGKRGKAEKVGEFTMAFVETPNMSEIHWVPDPNNSKIYVKEAVLSSHSRIFPPMA